MMTYAFQQPTFLVQPALNRFPTLHPMVTTPAFPVMPVTYAVPAPVFAPRPYFTSVAVPRFATSPFVVPNVVAAPVVVPRPIFARPLFASTIAVAAPMPYPAFRCSGTTVKFVIHGRRSSDGQATESFTAHYDSPPSRDRILQNMAHYADRAGFRNRRAYAGRATMYIVRTLGAVRVGDGEVTMSEDGVERRMEMKTERGAGEWAEAVRGRYVVVVVDMDKRVEGVA